MYINFKTTVWKRVKILPKLEKEILKDLQSNKITDIKDLFTDDFIGKIGEYLETELLLVSSQQMTVEDNKGKATIELYDSNDLIFSNTTINPPTCIITNSQFSWILEVDKQTISFSNKSSAEYFEKHYKNLGYQIIIKKENK